jgi:hypothetical protein
VRVLCPTCGEASQFETINVPSRGRLIICQGCDLVWTVRPSDVLEDLPSETPHSPATTSNDLPAPTRSRRRMAMLVGGATVTGLASVAAAYLWLGRPSDAVIGVLAEPRLSIVSSEVDRDTANKLLTVAVTVRNEGLHAANPFELCVRLLNRRSEPLFRWCEQVADQIVRPGEQSAVRLQIVSPPSDVASAEVQVN